MTHDEIKPVWNAQADEFNQRAMAYAVANLQPTLVKNFFTALNPLKKGNLHDRPFVHKPCRSLDMTTIYSITGEILYQSDKPTLKEAVEAAVAEGVSLGHANLANADLRDANLQGADLRRANLTSASLTFANLTGANLTCARMHLANFCGARLTGADLTNVKAESAALIGVDLEGANLADAYLESAKFRGANLAGANLTNAHLVKSDLQRATLTRVDLDEADLEGANLSQANLAGAGGSYLNLEGANLSHANLAGVELVSAIAQLANFAPDTLKGATIDGHAIISAIAFGPLGSRNDKLLAALTDDGFYFQTGCFFGTKEELLAAVESTHGGTRHERDYKLAIDFLETYLKDREEA